MFLDPMIPGGLAPAHIYGLSRSSVSPRQSHSGLLLLVSLSLAPHLSGTHGGLPPLSHAPATNHSPAACPATT